MAIAPINSLNLVNEIHNNSLTKASANTDDFISFKDILKNSIDNVNLTQQITEQDIVNIATGQADDLHTVMINSAKADLALQTLVQIRNKALDAYNEIMRINL